MELLWKQPSARREEYELRAGDEVLATLRWPKSWGSLAEAEVAEGRWTFKRVGFWRTRGTLRVAGDEDDIGTLEARWTGNGTLTLASGESYGWESTNLWGTRYGWSDSRGTELVRFGDGITPKGGGGGRTVSPRLRVVRPSSAGSLRLVPARHAQPRCGRRNRGHRGRRELVLA